VAAGNRNISNTNTEAQRDADRATNFGLGEIAKQNINGHTKALRYVQDIMKLGVGNKKDGSPKDRGALLKYFKLQKISALDPDTPNKLIVGKKGFESSILK